jgi:hypothetical protein
MSSTMAWISARMALLDGIGTGEQNLVTGRLGGKVVPWRPLDREPGRWFGGRHTEAGARTTAIAAASSMIAAPVISRQVSGSPKMSAPSTSATTGETNE